jgi:single-strand DNA-binding protein
VNRWAAGDVVEVEGALRRRFFRGGPGMATRLEVEVLAGRLVSRAPAVEAAEAAEA